MKYLLYSPCFNEHSPMGLICHGIINFISTKCCTSFILRRTWPKLVRARFGLTKKDTINEISFNTGNHICPSIVYAFYWAFLAVRSAFTLMNRAYILKQNSFGSKYFNGTTNSNDNNSLWARMGTGKKKLDPIPLIANDQHTYDPEEVEWNGA
jgi:hypothetical protein